MHIYTLHQLHNLGYIRFTNCTLPFDVRGDVLFLLEIGHQMKKWNDDDDDDGWHEPQTLVSFEALVSYARIYNSSFTSSSSCKKKEKSAQT